MYLESEKFVSRFKDPLEILTISYITLYISLIIVINLQNLCLFVQMIDDVILIYFILEFGFLEIQQIELNQEIR